MVKEDIDIDSLLDDLAYVDPLDKREIGNFESKHNCKITVDVEKINSLQYNYFYELDFDLDENLNVEIENGINNGTVLNAVEWGDSTKPDYREYEVLKDIVLKDWYYEDKPPLLKAKAQALLNRRKNELFEHHRKNSYDNYVTGGNSKLKLDPLLSELHLHYIYETVKGNVNFI